MYLYILKNENAVKLFGPTVLRWPSFPQVYTKEATFSISFDGRGGAFQQQKDGKICGRPMGKSYSLLHKTKNEPVPGDCSKIFLWNQSIDLIRSIISILEEYILIVIKRRDPDLNEDQDDHLFVASWFQLPCDRLKHAWCRKPIAICLSATRKQYSVKPPQRWILSVSRNGQHCPSCFHYSFKFNHIPPSFYVKFYLFSAYFHAICTHDPNCVAAWGPSTAGRIFLDVDRPEGRSLRSTKAVRFVWRQGVQYDRRRRQKWIGQIPITSTYFYPLLPSITIYYP